MPFMRRTCRRHDSKSMPTSFRNTLSMVLTLAPARAHRACNAVPRAGFASNAWATARARRSRGRVTPAGMGVAVSNCATRRSRSARWTRWPFFRCPVRTASTISSRSSGVTCITVHASGRPGARRRRRYNVRMATGAGMRMRWAVRAGIHRAKCGGISQKLCPTDSSITPRVA